MNPLIDPNRQITTQEEHAELALRAIVALDHPEKELLSAPQVDCSLVHHFGPNLCIREVYMPAGSLVIGHKQRFDQMNIMLTGKAMFVNDVGETVTLSAPLMFVGKPGRKIAFVLEDMIWQNVYSTDLTTVDEVEEFFIDKNVDWQDDYQTQFEIAQISHEMDRGDYLRFLDEVGLTEDFVRSITESTDDILELPETIFRVTNSPIEGKGFFVTSPVCADRLILYARVNGRRTQAGRYVNHSMNPNAEMVELSDGNIGLRSLVGIPGCVGGDSGTEITVDYRQAIKFSVFGGKSLCQP